MIDLLINRPVKSGNAFAYSHWRLRTKDRLSWMAHLRVHLSAATWGPPLGRRLVTITSYRARRLDDDNLSGGAKHLRDSLVRLGVLKDDTAQWCGFTYEQRTVMESPTGKACTRVVVTEAAP